MAEEEEPKNRRVVVESLGWLTESSIIPKKHHAIGGVGASSIMELWAQLYQSQEESHGPSHGPSSLNLASVDLMARLLCSARPNDVVFLQGSTLPFAALAVIVDHQPRSLHHSRRILGQS
ncbi:hypothetical protein ACFX1Z_020541 [Malus domestica]